MREKKIFSNKDYTKLRKSINDLIVELPENMAETPLLDLINTIGTIQAKQNTLDEIRESAEWNKVILENVLKRLEYKYEEHEEHLLIYDENIKTQSSKELRYAAAHQDKDLKEINSNILKVSNNLNKAKTLCNRIKSKSKLLESSFEKASRQLSGVDKLWDMGGFNEKEADKIVSKLESLRGTNVKRLK